MLLLLLLLLLQRAQLNPRDIFAKNSCSPEPWLQPLQLLASADRRPRPRPFGLHSLRETIRGHLCGLPRPRGSFPRSRPMGDLAFHRVALCRTSRRRWPSRTTCPRSSRRLHHVVTRAKGLEQSSRSTRRPRPERRPGARLRSIARLGLITRYTRS